MSIKEFFGWTTDRPPVGWFSAGHVIFVTCCILLTVALAILFGRRMKNGTRRQKQKVLLVSSVVMITAEVIKIVILSFRSNDVFAVRGILPLFLCSINLFVIPISAGNGRLSVVAGYFISAYGPLCALAGTFLASNYYDNWPILSFDVLVSTLTHCISGFAGLYVFFSGLLKDYNVLQDKSRYFLSSLILLPIAGLALIANALNYPSGALYESNYMFLRHSAGTPFSILETLTGHIPVLYTVSVITVYLAYGFLFSLIYYLYAKRSRRDLTVEQPA